MLEQNALLQLQKDLEALRASKGGKIDISDLDAIMASLSAALAGQAEQQNTDLYHEIHAIAETISQTKQGMGDGQEVAGSNEIQGANVQLDEVVKHTEEASNRIMDAAEKIQDALADVEGGAHTEISNAITEIFQACSFQDITGQRIHKVVKALDEIEASIERMMGMLSQAGIAVKQKTSDPKKVMTAEEERASLMEGPQVSDEAPNQDDIDRLFDNAP